MARMMTGLVAAVWGLSLAGLPALPALAETARLSLPGGQEVALPAGGVSGLTGPGLRLWLNEVTDQRCPSEYDCYWEGMIRAVIFVNPDAHGAQYVVLCNLCEDGQRTAVVAGYQLTLEHLEPDHAVIEGLGRAAVLADYTVVVIIAAAP
jgi:hypothetical protein